MTSKELLDLKKEVEELKRKMSEVYPLVGDLCDRVMGNDLIILTEKGRSALESEKV